MDMMDTVNSPPPASHDDTAAHPLCLEQDLPTGRMPTPIQPSFAAQVKGKHSGWLGSPNSGLIPNGVANLGHHVSGFNENQSVPRTMDGETDWYTLHNNRRLPSPISEVGDSGSCQHGGPTSDVPMDSDHVAQSRLSAQLESSSLSGHQDTPDGMHHPNTELEPALPPNILGAELEGDPSSPSPNRRGHQRSKHTVNSWTWQPGMKKSFSIGYRSDCEKCRLKVPGHFNHIVIS